MKIGMQTWGSHGDIRPMLALAEGLHAAGHEVHLVITCVDSAAYADIPSKPGLKLSVLASPVITPEQGGKIAEIASAIRNPMQQMTTLLRLCYDPVEDQMFKAAQALCADAELLIGHYFMHPLQIAAEKAGRPYVSVLLSHAAVPSALIQPMGVPDLGKTGARFFWWLTKQLINRAMLPYPNRLRRKLGMLPTQDMVAKVWLSQPLTLLAVSPQICRQPADWPSSVKVCGFLDMPNMALEGQLPTDLSDFLQAGEAPIYMTFGSWMPQDIPSQTLSLQLLTQAAQLAGCRAIIQSSNWQACGFQSNQQILYVAAAPHHAIFPHCLAVLHHGGAGTTQSTTLAGKPSVVVAHISEQEHWGHELQRIGIAGRPLTRRKVTPQALAGQIQFVRTNAHLQANAQTIALAMRGENGVAEAVSAINRQFGALS